MEGTEQHCHSQKDAAAATHGRLAALHPQVSGQQLRALKIITAGRGLPTQSPEFQNNGI